MGNAAVISQIVLSLLQQAQSYQLVLAQAAKEGRDVTNEERAAARLQAEEAIAALEKA
jgi:hypothetical protein